MASAVNIVYNPAPTIKAFQESQTRITGIMGPVGSGKTSGCVIKLLQKAAMQPKWPDGIRRSRFAILRATYPQLKSTTMKTWQTWTTKKIPGLYEKCPIRWDAPYHQVLRINDWEAEIYFMGVEDDNDVDKLQSFELTAAWIHEADGVSEEVFKMLRSRIRRFPLEQGPPKLRAVHPEIMMDYNAVDPDHWLYKYAEEETPEGWAFFKQPSALLERQDGPIKGPEGKRFWVNPEAENLNVLDPEYYAEQVEGNTFDWIRRFLMNEYGFMREGMPVYSSYNDRTHFFDGDLPAYPGVPLILCFDFGLTPACAICQFTPKGQFRVLDEVVTPDGRTMGIAAFCDNLLLPYLSQFYAGFNVMGWGDPAGATPAESDEKTCFDELENRKLIVQPAYTNKIGARINAVEKLLGRLIDGKPGFLLSKKCKTLHAGFLGKYRFARKAVKGREGMYHSVPLKNHYSHVHDALQYGAMGVLGPVSSFGQVDPRLLAQLAEQQAYRPLDAATGY